MGINQKALFHASDLDKKILVVSIYMGGYGSTRWNYHDKREIVENCLALDAFYISRLGVISKNGHKGALEWRNPVTGIVTGTIGYVIESNCGHSIINFIYTVKSLWNSKDVVMPVIIRPGNRRFGGNQNLFVCPLVKKGVPCQRLVRKLYLPQGYLYFGCRHCYDLTYRSCQDSDYREFLNIYSFERKLLDELKKPNDKLSDNKPC